MVIDFHAHLLPGLDHGCQDIQTSILQMKMAKSARVDLIVASSHFYPHIDIVDDFLSRRQDAFEELSCQLSPELPRLLLGAEIFVCEGMEKMNGLMRLCIENSESLLLEMPEVHWNHRIIDTVLRINEKCQGKAVLAHVDRYYESNVDALFEQGLNGQINVANLCKRKNRNRLLRWINDNKIVGLGSDIHGKTKAYKQFCKARSILGEQFSEIMKYSERLLQVGERIKNNH